MARKKADRKVAALKVKRMKLEDLTPADYNPRTITEDELAGLSRSVEEFGLVEPMVWNKRTSRLVAGHQRLKVLARQGVDEVDVSVVDLDEDHEKMLNVTLNNPEIQGGWSERLPSLLEELKTIKVENELFSEVRLDALMHRVDFDKLNDFKKPELDGSDVPAIPAKGDGNWFFVEFYGKDDLFAELQELLAGSMRTEHEIKAEDFAKMLRSWKK